MPRAKPKRPRDWWLDGWKTLVTKVKHRANSLQRRPFEHRKVAVGPINYRL
jgi:hypothetical protein